MQQDKATNFPRRPGGRVLIFAGLLAAALLLCLQGCAGSPEKKTAPEKTDFTRQWLEKAEQSRGYSPRVEKRETMEIDGRMKDADPVPQAAAKAMLPDQKVTLHLRNAPVAAVLRAMAKSADINILVNETVDGTMSVNIENIAWNQAFQSILDSRGLTWSRQGDLIRIQSMADLEKQLALSGLLQQVENQKDDAQRAGPIVSRIIRINYADAEKLSEVLTKFLPRQNGEDQRGAISVDTGTNSLVLQASRHDINRMHQVIQTLDKPRSQILIEANIVEANQETAKELGMRWSGRYITSAGTFDDFGITGEPRAPEESFIDPEAGLSLGVAAGRFGGNILYAQLLALQEEGQLNILSSPSITTMDNQTAYTEHGERIPFETTDDEGRPEVEFEDAVLRLEVTPHIIDGKHMRMRINVKNDEVDFTRTVEGNPVIRAKDTETNLVVENGETIVISGLSKQTISDLENGVPVLKDIPLLGRLFKGTEKSEEMQEFMIFITLTILGTKTQ